MADYKAASALREHLLEGHSITLLEAILLFGVQGPNAEIVAQRGISRDLQ